MAFNLVASLQLQLGSGWQTAIANAQRQLSGIKGNVTLNVSSAVAQLTQLKASAQAAASSVTNLARSGAASLNSLTDAAQGATRAIAGIGLGVGIADAARQAVAFDKALVQLRQTGNDTREEIGGVANEITRLASTLGASSSELAGVAVQLRQAGLSADATGKALEAIGKASLSPSFSSMKETTEAVVATMRQFGVEAGGMKETLGSIAAISAGYAAESADLVTAIQKAGGAAAASGADLNQFLALFTSIRATTREAAPEIASGLKTIFTRLQRADTVDTLARLGVQLRDSKGQFIGAFEAVSRLNEALANVPTTDTRFAQVVEALGGYRQVSRVIPLIQQFRTAQEAANVGKYGAGSLDVASAQAQDAIATKLAKVREEYLALGRTIANDGPLRSLVDLFLAGASGAAKLGGAIATLVPALAALSAVKAAQGIGGSLGLGAVGGKGGLAALGGVALAGAALGQLGTISPNNSPAQNSNARIAAGAQGALSLGLAGAAVGSAFGPLGIAIGATTGALYGMVTAVQQANKELDQMKTDAVVRLFSGNIGGLASGARDVNDQTLAEATAQLNELLATASRRGYEQTASTFSRLDPAALREAQRLQFGQLAGQLLPQLAGTAQRDIERLSREARAGDTGADVFSRFRSSSFGQTAIFGLAQGSNKSVNEVEADFAKLAVSTLRLTRANENAAGAAAQMGQAITNFGALVGAVRDADESLSGLRARADALAAVFEGRQYTAALPSLQAGVSRPDGAEFIGAVARLTGQLGTPGDALRGQADSLSLLTRVLPDIIRQAAQTTPLGGDELSVRIAEALRRQGGIQQQQIQAIVSAVEQREAKSPGGTFEALRTRGAGAVSDELLRELADPLRNVLDGLAKELDQQGTRFVQSLATNEGLVARLRDESGKLADAQLNLAKVDAVRQADQAGKVNARPAELLSLAELQRPFLARQEALTGRNGRDALNPLLISDQFQATLSRLEQVRQDRDQAAPGSARFNELAGEFARLQSQAGNLQAALRQLADSSTRAATIQEKLSSVQAEREGRLSVGERLLRGGPAEQARFAQGLALAGQTARTGNVNGLAPQAIDTLFSVLDQLKDVRLPLFEGRTGAEQKQRLVANTLPGFIPAELSKQEADLKGQLTDVFATGVAAQKALVDTQGQLQREFFESLKAQNEAFLLSLSKNLVGVQVGEQKAKIDQLIPQRQQAQAKADQADILRGAGVDQSVLAVLRAPDNLKKVEAIAKAQEELVANRANITARVNGLGAFDVSRFNSGTISPGGLLDFSGPNGLFDLSRLGPQSARNKLESAGQSDAVLAAISELLQRQGLDSFDPKGVAASFTTRAVANVDQFRAASSDPAQLADVLRQTLTAALREQIPFALGGQATALNQQKDDLIRSTGLPIESLRPVLGAIQESGGRFVEALKGVDDLAKATRELAEVNRQLTTAQQAVKGLEQGGGQAIGKAAGGSIFKARGTDTVPAMLAPGEFVVNADSARHNALLLKQINDARGPVYRAGGGRVQVVDRVAPTYAERFAPASFYRAPKLYTPGTIPEADVTMVGADGRRDEFFASPARGIVPLAQANQLYTPEAYRRGRLYDPYARRPAVADEASPFKVPDAAPALDPLEQAVSENAVANPGGASAAYLARQNAVALAAAAGFNQANQQYVGDRAANRATIAGRAGNLRSRQLLANAVDPLAFFGLGRPDFGVAGQFRSASLAQQASYNVQAEQADPGIAYLRQAIAQGRGRVSGFASGPATLARVQRFAAGGLVGDGASAGLGPIGLSPEVAATFGRLTGELTTFAGSFGSSVGQLNSSFVAFGSNASALADALKAFPAQIQVNHGQQRVEVVLNGAEVLSRLQPDIEKYVADQTRAALSRVFRDQLPEAGVNVE